jgi:hypothetical protein
VLSLTIYQKETLMANTKLLKVMDYLINEQEDKARELLHQIFIEKARAIHEEMMATEEPEMGGDMGDDFAADIKADQEAIDSEEHYNPMEGDEEDIDVDDAVEDLGDELDMIDDEDEGMEDADDSEDMEVDTDMDADADADDDAHMDADMDAGEDHDIKDLEQAIAELKAEFEALKSEVEGDEDHSEDKVDEAWESDNSDDLDEEYDDLDENIDLETVQAAKGGEVGSGKFAAVDANKHSPVPSTQRDTMGAKAVVVGKGPKASGYDRQSAPSAGHVGPATNRRKKAEDGMSGVSKEGSAKAMLNKDRSEGFGAPGTRSPIQGK